MAGVPALPEAQSCTTTHVTPHHDESCPVYSSLQYPSRDGSDRSKTHTVLQVCV